MANDIDAQAQHCVDNHELIGKVEATHRDRYARIPVCARPECQETAHAWVQSMTGRRGAFTPFEQDRATETGGE